MNTGKYPLYDIFVEGEKAYEKAKPIEKNPYKKDKIKNKAWNVGWLCQRLSYINS